MDLATLLPAGGIAGTLAIVIVYLLNSNRLDRAERRLERDEDRKAITALRTDHDAQMAALRARMDALEKEVDEERRRRLAAEELAASEGRRAAAAEHALQLTLASWGGRDDARGTGTAAPGAGDPPADLGGGRRGLPGGVGVDDVPGHA